MSETLPRSASAPNKIDVATPDTEELEMIVNGNAASKSPETEPAFDDREPSHAASILYRVADFFKDRAINKAHGEALREDKQRVEQAQDEANASYEDNIAFTRDRKREEFINSVEAKIDTARDFVTAIGRNALEYGAKAGLVTLGVGIVAGEAVKTGAERAYANSKDVAETGALHAMYAADSLKDTYQNTKNTFLEKLGNMKTAALARREARRAKWTARKQSALEFIDVVKANGANLASVTLEKGQGVIDSARNEGQRVIGETTGRINAARAAGRAALEVYSAHNEQNKL